MAYTGFQLATARLSQSGDWEAFLSAYREYNAEILKQMISSPLDQLQIAQGRARHADELLRLFEAARTTKGSL